MLTIQTIAHLKLLGFLSLVVHFRSSYRVVLVPKLRLGTHFREVPLRYTGHNPSSSHRSKQSFEYTRSQAALGNEARGQPDTDLQN